MDNGWRDIFNERMRTYWFPDPDPESPDAVSQAVEIESVVSLRVSPTGTHYIETAAGRKLIVKNTWLVLEIDADEWSF